MVRVPYWLTGLSEFNLPDFFMARRAIPMIAFPRVRTIYIYIFFLNFLVSLTRVCVVYVVKEVASFPGARSINGRGA